MEVRSQTWGKPAVCASHLHSSPVNAPVPCRGRFYSCKGRAVFRSIQCLVPFTKTLIGISVTRTVFTRQNWYSTSRYCTEASKFFHISQRGANKQWTLPIHRHHFCIYDKITGACFADLSVLQLRTPERSSSVSKNTANISLLLPNRINILISIVGNTVTNSSWTA